MPNKRIFGGLIAATVFTAGLGAQQITSCAGPGAAFGVTAYNCANCSLKQATDQRTQFVFGAEPIVLEVTSTSALKSGDVVEAVNDAPITTLSGAEQFAYPRQGTSVITVRRGNARVRVSATAASCDARTEPTVGAKSNSPLLIVDGVVVSDLTSVPRDSIQSVDVQKDGAVTARYGARAAQGVITIRTKRPQSKPSSSSEPLIVADGAVVSGTPPEVDGPSSNGRRFGFAIGCVVTCGPAKAPDGTEYYKFEGYPTIVALVNGGAAMRAGIRVGDVVTQIDGKSILRDEGALGFFRANRDDTMRVTVLRDQREVAYVLRSR
jgi:TonB-dependent SusC/RagA subfamily outer membrane receptor